MRAFNRFGGLVIGAICSFFIIAVYLNSRTISTRLESFGFADYMWDWSNPNDTQLAVVVFGDSWVDDGVVMGGGRGGGVFGLGSGSKESTRSQLQGPSWTEVLCKEVCITEYSSSLINYVKLI